ncbi:MAG: TAXI family TRAP transporter solute-binding subunit, partial [Gemmatimonadota bacterium]
MRINSIATAGLTALLLLLLAGCEGGAGRSYLSIGTGSTGGVYYPVGGALASMLSADFPDRQFTAEVTAASVENVTRMLQGEMDLGFAISTTIINAHNGGTPQFPEPMNELRIIAPLWPNPLNVLVPANTEIESLRDLRGRRVSVGAPGSGTEEVSRMLFAAYDMSYDDIDERFLSFTESSSAIRDGSLALAFLQVAYPAAAVLEATTTNQARLFPLEGPEIDALTTEFPHLYKTTIPAGVYRGIDEPIPTIAELNWVVGPESLDPEIVTRILDILQDERARLIQVNDIVRQVDLQNLRSPPIPLHPATEAWMAE